MAAKIASSWKSAASVIILSRTTGRILMMQRGPTAAFMPNAIVFPGGVVSPEDEKLGPAAKIAALREVFEETGLLVTQDGVETSVQNNDLALLQNKVKDDAGEFKKVSLNLGTESLIEWNTWLTPTTHGRRYMTSFFLLPVDGEPSVNMCEKEMTANGWESPSVILEKAFKCQVPLPPPQVYELTRLSQTKIDNLPSLGNLRRVICPQIIAWKDSKRVTNVFPGDHLYIESDAYSAPGRSMPDDEVAVNFDRPTHRQEYLKTPQWGECRIYQQKLAEPYQSDFQKFVTHSKL